MSSRLSSESRVFAKKARYVNLQVRCSQSSVLSTAASHCCHFVPFLITYTPAFPYPQAMWRKYAPLIVILAVILFYLFYRFVL
jgi:hypothetical protein